MKKTTGKVVSLVLALALVVTSFSATFAFAATKSVTGTVSSTDHDDEIYLANGSGENNSVDLKSWINPELDTKDHQDVSTDVDITAISHVSGDSLVKWKIDEPSDGDAQLTVKSTTKDGTEVISVLYESTYTNDDGDDVTVKARKNFTVHVLDADSIVIGKVYDSGAADFQQTGDDSRKGKEMEAPSSFAQTAYSYKYVGVYKVVKDSGSAMATYVPVPVTTKSSGITATSASDVYNISISGDDVYYGADTSIGSAAVNTAIGNDAGTGNVTPLILKVGKRSNRANDAGVSNVTVTVKKLVAETGTSPVTYKASTDSADKYTLKTKIEKKVDVAASTLAGVTKFTIEKSSGNTILKDTTGVVDQTLKVTDTEIVFPTTTLNVNADEGSVKKISGTVGDLAINDDATVGSVDIDEGIVSVDGGKVGDITTSGAAGDVTVSSGKAGNIDTTDATTDTVVVNGGTVGTIDSDSLVTVNSTDEDTTISTGKITALTVDVFADEANVSIAGITATDDGSEFTIKGEKASVGAVDFDYYDTALNLGDDDDAFTGTIAAPVNAIDGKIVTENEDTVATVTGTVNVDTVTVGSDTKLALPGDVTVGSVDGDGALTIQAGKLYVSDSVSGTTLKLSDTTLAAGTTVFKADSDTVDVDDFNTFGFTLAKTEGSSVDTFKIDSINFAGVVIDQSTANVAVGYSKTFTAVAYPTGTSLPAGSTIVWDFDGSDDVFNVTTSGNTATVTVKALDSTFASENKGTLTATLNDADGYEMDDYEAATSTVTAIAVPEATSDTTSNVSVAKGASYTFKITSTTAPSFGVGTAGVFTVALASHTGNDYFYKITATGNVGASTGIYLNGTKLLVASVKSAFTVDTTKDVTVKGSYTLKVTSAATPTLGVGTAGVFNAQFVTKTGNDYFYKLTSVGAVGTKAGIFVDGTKVFVATVG